MYLCSFGIVNIVGGVIPNQWCCLLDYPIKTDTVLPTSLKRKPEAEKQDPLLCHPEGADVPITAGPGPTALGELCGLLSLALLLVKGDRDSGRCWKVSQVPARCVMEGPHTEGPHIQRECGPRKSPECGTYSAAGCSQGEGQSLDCSLFLLSIYSSFNTLHVLNRGRRRVTGVWQPPAILFC